MAGAGGPSEEGCRGGFSGLRDKHRHGREAGRSSVQGAKMMLLEGRVRWGQREEKGGGRTRPGLEGMLFALPRSGDRTLWSLGTTEAF